MRVQGRAGSAGRGRGEGAIEAPVLLAAWRQLGEGLSSMMVHCNAQREIEWVNAAFTRVTGWRAAQVVGRRPGSLLCGPGTDPATIERLRRRLDAGRGASGVEMINYTCDGRPFWVAWSVHVLVDAEGRTSHVVAVQGEVSDRKRADAALRQSEERFRMMAELSVDWYWEQDEAYRFTDISHGFEAPSGLTRDRLLGRTRWELFPDALTPTQWAAHRRMLDGRDEFRGLELRLRRPGRPDAWVSVSGRPRYVDGIFAGYHGVASDISAARRSKIALRDANAQLEQRVAERTAELRRTNDELRRVTHRLALAKAAAESASVDKSQLLATMSHEIRTPMSGVLGSLDLLQCTTLGNRQRALVDAALSSGESLMALLNELLDLSKIEAGRLQLSRAPFSLRAIAAPVVELFQANAAAKGLALRGEIATDAADAVVGDAHRLRQVLVNLVGNAVKFTSRGEVRLRVQSHTGQDGTVCACFQVSDTGVGIPADALPRLFQPFFQVPGAAFDGARGTGLGLSISQRIVQAMGGTIDVDTEASRGSVFRFELRLTAAESSRDAGAGVAPRPGTPGPTSGAPVLVVEDSPVNRLVATEMLVSLGVQVHEAENGLQAVELAERHPYALVLMDCDLPVLDGYAATQRLREREARLGLPRTPIVALSANAYEEDVRRALQSGMDGHLAKPYTRRQLADLLQRWVSVATESA